MMPVFSQFRTPLRSPRSLVVLLVIASVTVAWPERLTTAGEQGTAESSDDVARRIAEPLLDLKTTPDPLLDPQLDDPLSLNRPMSLSDELQLRQQERDARYRRLRGQLKDLMLRIESCEPKSPSGGQDVPADAAAPSATDSPNQTTSAPDPEAGPDSTQSTQNPPDVSPTEQAPAPQPALPEPPAADSRETVDPAEARSVFLESMQAAAVVDGPVDRVALADNLYALKEFSIALEMYQQVDLKTLPGSQRHWVTFQMASCHRRLKQTSEAQSLYRRLAGQKSAGWLASTARWWLDQIDSRTALEEELARNASVLDRIKPVYEDRDEENEFDIVPGGADPATTP